MSVSSARMSTTCTPVDRPNRLRWVWVNGTVTRDNGITRDNDQMKGGDVPRGARDVGINYGVSTTSDLTTLWGREPSYRIPSTLRHFGVSHTTIRPMETARWFQTDHTNTAVVASAMAARAINRVHPLEAFPRSSNVVTWGTTAVVPTTRAARMALISMPIQRRRVVTRRGVSLSCAGRRTHDTHHSSTGARTAPRIVPRVSVMRSSTSTARRT